ncbi:MAG: septum formation initiator family protein [Candidatus Poribacteria bacterium]
MMEYGTNYPKRKKVGGFSIMWRLLICIIVTIVFSVQIYTFGDAFKYWWGNKEIKKKYTQLVSQLEQQQEMMKKEILNLKNNKLAQERLAREMGYIKPGEIVYKFINNPLTPFVKGE